MWDRLNEIVEKNRDLTTQGHVADYIPELGKVNPRILGATIATTDGEIVSAGDCDTNMTIQSISKVITLILAVMDRGMETVFEKVGMEPSGDPFNTVYRLETRTPTKPLNPMINAGAIVVSSMIQGQTAEERLNRIIDLVRRMSGNPYISYSQEVYQSESQSGDLNRSLAYFLKEHDIIDNVEETLDLYFRQCAIWVTCSDLAKIGLCLAQQGINTEGHQVVPRWMTRMAKAFMVTCGMYNESGEFAIRAGIPAKSGVSGGIMAAVPQQMGIGVIGPALNEKGNSVAGMQLLQDMAQAWRLSIF